MFFVCLGNDEFVQLRGRLLWACEQHGDVVVAVLASLLHVQWGTVHGRSAGVGAGPEHAYGGQRQFPVALLLHHPLHHVLRKCTPPQPSHRHLRNHL